MTSLHHENPIGNFLPWDTEFFGFRIGRLNRTRLTPCSLQEASSWAATESLRCLYFFADAECAETLNCAHRGGFKFIDLRMEFSLMLHSAPNADTSLVREAANGDLSDIEALSRIAHQDTRFFKDTEFDPIRSGDLYAAWIQRDFKQHYILVIRNSASQLAGYITCQLEADQRVGRIGLVAVDTTQRKQGYGRTLVAAALQWFRKQGCIEAKVVTQASNVAAQRVYQSFGFRTAEANATFHRWFPLS